MGIRTGSFLAMLLVGLTACDAGESGGVSEASPPTAPTLRVSTVPLRRGRMDRQWVLYGSVASLTSSVRGYTLPFEARIAQIDVSVGQHVEAGDPLFHSLRSPTTAVAVRAAADRRREASQSLEQVKSRRADGLATRDEVIKAEGVLRRANQQLSEMQRAGELTAELTVKAERSGVVSATGLTVGTLAPIGTNIVSIAEDATTGVQLWVLPGKARELKVGAKVALEPLAATAGKPTSGQIVRVDERVDTVTRLVRVAVGLDEPGALLLGQPVRARVAVGAAEGFVVPRTALVAVDGVYRIYTVDDGRARAVEVTVAVESGDELLVRGDLHEQDAVITVGAYQAEDGMLVETRP